ncbi:hypothetical protein MAR_027696 [Mya arenaria]|uniref:Uncharacterized protein n=1 Tax=Mya arenaria TaxID=6604 RepID=A0ABY7EXG1_MYAAR|nr:hypothetical protein MAR_027696 [Mya arenaria]
MDLLKYTGLLSLISILTEAERWCHQVQGVIGSSDDMCSEVREPAGKDRCGKALKLYEEKETPTNNKQAVVSGWSGNALPLSADVWLRLASDFGGLVTPGLLLWRSGYAWPLTVEVWLRLASYCGGLVTPGLLLWRSGYAWPLTVVVWLRLSPDCDGLTSYLTYPDYNRARYDGSPGGVETGEKEGKKRNHGNNNDNLVTEPRRRERSKEEACDHL